MFHIKIQYNLEISLYFSRHIKKFYMLQLFPGVCDSVYQCKSCRISVFFPFLHVFIFYHRFGAWHHTIKKDDSFESSFNQTGNVLLSQAASHQVSSALRSLTSVFEMGTGVTSSLLSPDSLCTFKTEHISYTYFLKPLVKFSTY